MHCLLHASAPLSVTASGQCTAFFMLLPRCLLRLQAEALSRKEAAAALKSKSRRKGGQRGGGVGAAGAFERTLRGTSGGAGRLHKGQRVQGGGSREQGGSLGSEQQNSRHEVLQVRWGQRVQEREAGSKEAAEEARSGRGAVSQGGCCRAEQQEQAQGGAAGQCDGCCRLVWWGAGLKVRVDWAEARRQPLLRK